MDARRRLFFALWPEAAVAEKLHATAKSARLLCGGRPMGRDTLHMTLAFLGEVAESRVDVVCAVADTVSQMMAQKVGASGTASAATLRDMGTALIIDRLEFWRHNHIVWAGCTATPLVLTTLADELVTGLRNGGFELDRRSFTAHVTLLRNAACAAPPPALAPLEWIVRDFVLVESTPAAEGAHYQILKRWPLR